MYKLCKTEQSAARQRRLEQGLLEAMKQKRYDEISISDLCDRMEIPRKSFYRYFTGKDGALQALIDHTLMEFADYTESYRQGKVRTIQLDLESFFQFWIQRKDLLDVLTHSGLSGLLVNRAVAFALTDDVLPIRFLPDENRTMQQHITMFGVCGLMSMVLNWHDTGYAIPAQEMARVAVRMISRPLFPGVESLVKD